MRLITHLSSPLYYLLNIYMLCNRTLPREEIIDPPLLIDVGDISLLYYTQTLIIILVLLHISYPDNKKCRLWAITLPILSAYLLNISHILCRLFSYNSQPYCDKYFPNKSYLEANTPVQSYRIVNKQNLWNF